jgi:hypothetical protein
VRPVAPRVGSLPEVTIAEDQHQFLTLVGAVTTYKNGSGMLTRWRLTDEERERVVKGEDLYLELLTFGKPVQPIILSIGVPNHLRGI